MPHDFIPSRDSGLLAWSSNFSAQISAAPGPPPAGFGVSAAQAAAYAVLHSAYANAYAVASDPSTNSKSNVAAKNMAKAALKADARALARLIRATPGITNSQRAQLGLTVYAFGSEGLGGVGSGGAAVSRPDNAPTVSLLPSTGRTVRIRLRDAAAPMRKGKPPGVAGAAVLSYVARSTAPGAPEEHAPPVTMAEWTFHGIATRRFFDVNFDGDVPSGARVWIAAAWFNTRGKFGPPSTSQLTRIGEGVSKFLIAA